MNNLASCKQIKIRSKNFQELYNKPINNNFFTHEIYRFDSKDIMKTTHRRLKWSQRVECELPAPLTKDRSHWSPHKINSNSNRKQKKERWIKKRQQQQLTRNSDFSGIKQENGHNSINFSINSLVFKEPNKCIPSIFIGFVYKSTDQIEFLFENSIDYFQLLSIKTLMKSNPSCPTALLFDCIIFSLFQERGNKALW